MSGYVMAFSRCLGCGRYFGYNPITVPSYRSPQGEREPICASCIELMNQMRIDRGLPPHPVAPDAYEAADERDLPG